MDSPTQPPATNSAAQHPAGGISLVEIVNVLLRHRRLIVLLPLALAFLAGVWSLTRPRAYEVSTSLLPEGVSTQSGGIAGLARQFGFGVGSGSGSSPLFYADLLQGRELLRKAVESEYEVPTDGDGTVTATLIELYGIEESKWLPKWQVAADQLETKMDVTVAAATGVVELTVSAGDPALAEQIAARLLQLLNEFNLETRQTRAAEEGRFVAERMGEMEDALRAAEETLKTFLEHNRAINSSPELTFELDRLQRQVSMRQSIFTSLAQAYEQARIDGVRDTPVFTVVMQPEGAARPQPRRTPLRAVLGLMAGSVLALLVAFTREFLRRIRKTEHDESGEYREFSRLREEARKDLLRPVRVLRRRRIKRQLVNR